MAVSWPSLLRVTVLILLIAAIIAALYTLPVEKVLKDFLVWIKQNLGPWGPLVLAISYIPLTVLAIPASILTLGGGYLFGLPVGFVADSIGATIGSTVAFMLGRTIVLLLRLVPLLPFNMLNYLLSVTPVGVGEYMMASWLGMMPITLALVYVGTTLKDLADVTHGWNEVSTSRWIFIICGFVVSAILMVCITKVAKSSLEAVLAENPEGEGILVSSQLPIVSGPPFDLHQPLVIKIEASSDDHDK